MAKINLSDLTSGHGQIDTINANNALIEAAINDLVAFRDIPSGETAPMLDNLDMNAKRLLNLPTPTSSAEAATKAYVDATTVPDTTTTVTTVTEAQTATASQVTFTLTGITYTPGANNLDVYINGVHQDLSEYTETSTSVVTLSSGAEAGDVVFFKVNQRSVDATTSLASNVIYTPAGTSAVVSDVQTALSRSVWLTDFGTVGDGSADDTNAINAAYAHAETVQGELLVPPGDYKITSQLVWDGDVSVRGVGANSQLAGATGVTFIASGDFNAIAISNANDNKFENFFVSRDSGGGAGIVVNDGNNIDFRNITIRDMVDGGGLTGHGLWIEGGFFGVYNSVHTVDNTGDGYRLEGNGLNSSPAVAANTFISCTGNMNGGVGWNLVSVVNNNLFEGCSVENGSLQTPAGTGIQISRDQSDTVTITNDTPAVFTYAGSDNWKNGNTIQLTTTDTLPTGLALLTSYFITNIDTSVNTFEVEASIGGGSVATSSAGSGTHTATWKDTVLNNRFVSLYLESNETPEVLLAGPSQGNYLDITAIISNDDDEIKDLGTYNAVYAYGISPFFHLPGVKGGYQGTVGGVGRAFSVDGGAGNNQGAAASGGQLHLRGGEARGTGDANGAAVLLDGGDPVGTGVPGPIQIGGRQVAPNEVTEIHFKAPIYVSQAAETVTDSEACSVDNQVSHLVTTAAATPTLDDGTNGQHKKIIMKTHVGDAVLTPSNLADGTTITFRAVGETAELYFSNSAWHFMGGTASLDTAPLLPTISGVGATRTLLARESGSICLFDRAAGIVYTLPAPVVGLKFRFITTVTRTSNSETISTDAGSTFLQGGITQIIDTSATSEGQFGDGTTHVSLAMNGTTTGGIIGTDLTFECITATQWQVSGIVNSSGVLTTPFA